MLDSKLLDQFKHKSMDDGACHRADVISHGLAGDSERIEFWK